MYDYVIVGAGSAGCVLASRLTEDPAVSVLLLEAGGADKNQAVHVPIAYAKLFKTAADWNYETEPQPSLKNRQIYWPRGKMLGGTSSLNAMAYVRGNPYDYDHWADLGNPGWAFADVLPYFKRAEHYEGGNAEWYGSGGPLNIAEQRSPHPLSAIFLAAAAEAGMPPISDFNGARTRAGYLKVTQRGGKRWSSADAYLRPTLKRSNLAVHTLAQATKVLLEGKRAVGIRYLRNGVAEEARVHREVILCGGTINSPQLLLLSGIGPADDLKALGIEITAVLPGVGHNLQDHLAAGAQYHCTQPITFVSAEKPSNFLKYMAQYVLLKRGPFTSIVGEVAGFEKSQPDLLAPDLEFVFAASFFVEHGFGNPPGQHGYTIGVTLLHPESRGHLALRSTNPTEPPKIQPAYLSNEHDLDVLIEGVKRCRKLGQAKAFDPYRGAEFLPGEGVQSDAELAEFIRSRAETLYHPVGTCKMGEAPQAVVDPELCVRGIEGLRVVDASVMPTLISGHINAPTIMIAEKAADLIRGRAASTKASQTANTPTSA